MNKQRPQKIPQKQDNRQFGNIDSGQTDKIKIRHDQPGQLTGKSQPNRRYDFTGFSEEHARHQSQQGITDEQVGIAEQNR